MRELRCIKCNEIKTINEFTTNKSCPLGIEYICKVCNNKRSYLNSKKNRQNRLATKKRYYEKNKDKIKIYARAYRERTKEHRNKQRRARRAIDPIYQMQTALRARCSDAFNRISLNKKTKTISLLGAEWTIIKSHIEAQFLVGMTWENYGNATWHIDHIIPLASATTEIELIKLCHYKNLQPLWAMDNIKKGSKLFNITLSPFSYERT